MAQLFKYDSPGEDCAEATHHCRVENVMKKDTASETDNCGLHEESKGRMDEGKIAIGHLPEGDARGAVECVARVPENRDMGVLPENDGCRSEEETGSHRKVARSPTFIGRARVVRRWRLYRRHEGGSGTRIKVIRAAHLTHIMCALILC